MLKFLEGNKIFPTPIPVFIMDNLVYRVYWASISILQSLIKHEITSACTQ